MIRIIIIFILIIACISIFLYPYIPVIIYYAFAILQPQEVWFWACADLRVSFVPAVASIIAFIIQLSKGIEFKLIKHKELICMILLWLWMWLSTFWGAYPVRSYGMPTTNAGWILEYSNKMFIMAIIATYLIRERIALKLLVLSLILVTIYLIYWGNMQYITGAMYRCNILGRLNGPYNPAQGGAGVYTESNCFATLYVCMLPFLYGFFQYFKKIYFKIGILLIIILGWHCVFLTGSRGGLVGLVVTLMVLILRSKKKLWGVLLLVVLYLFFLWQGGALMKKRAGTIENYKTDKSAEERIVSWGLALKMMHDHPFFGVGLGNFIMARAKYGDPERLCTMSTPLQYGAECGIPAMLFFIGSIAFSILNLDKLRRFLLKRNMEEKDVSDLLAILNGLESSLIGYTVCGIFLSLLVFEPYMMLIALICILKNIVREELGVIT